MSVKNICCKILITKIISTLPRLNLRLAGGIKKQSSFKHEYGEIYNRFWEDWDHNSIHAYHLVNYKDGGENDKLAVGHVLEYFIKLYL